MFFDKDIINILLECNLSPKVTIITSKSCYKGCTYKVYSSWGESVLVKRNGRNVHYNPGSFELTKETYESFKNLKSDKVIDFFKKDIDENDIIFNNGRLFKVIKIIRNHVFLEIIGTSDFYENMWDEWVEDHMYYGGHDDDEFLQLTTSEISIFIKITDPLDLLTI